MDKNNIEMSDNSNNSNNSNNEILEIIKQIDKLNISDATEMKKKTEDIKNQLYQYVTNTTNIDKKENELKLCSIDTNERNRHKSFKPVYSQNVSYFDYRKNIDWHEESSCKDGWRRYDVVLHCDGIATFTNNITCKFRFRFDINVASFNGIVICGSKYLSDTTDEKINKMILNKLYEHDDGYTYCDCIYGENLKINNDQNQNDDEMIYKDMYSWCDKCNNRGYYYKSYMDNVEFDFGPDKYPELNNLYNIFIN